MSKIYRHRPMMPDKLLGYVEPKSGQVLKSRFGPDIPIGRVDLETGKVYRGNLGGETYLGRVNLKSGQIYQDAGGEEVYVGGVEADGKFYRQITVTSHQYLAQVSNMTSFAEAGAGFLLFFVEEKD